MAIRKTTDMIVIHCSATPPTMNVDVKDIRRWHINNGWADVGYHFVIKRDGEIQNGRDINEVGAHVAGHNSHTVGVCLVGGTDARGRAECSFTDAQWASLRQVIHKINGIYGELRLRGHHDLFRGKDCPSFNVQTYAEKEGFKY